MYRTILFVLSAVFLTKATWAQDESRVDLNALIEEALRNNPKLHSARHQTEAAKLSAIQVTAWDAPQIGIEFYQMPIGSFPLVPKDNMETDFFIQQMVPWPGKLSLMSQAIEYKAGMKEQETMELNNRIIRDLKTAYYELYIIQKKIDFNKENKQIVQQIVHIAEKQYETGSGSQSEILRTQTEMSRLMSEEISLHRDRRVMEAMVNTLIGREANSELGAVAEPVINEGTFDYNKLFALAIQHRPELKAMDYNIQMNRSELKLAHKELYPDLMIRGMYKNMSNTSKDFWSLMIGVNVPIAYWSKNKYQGKAKEMGQHIQHAQMEYQDMRNMIGNDIQTALVNFESSRQQADENKKHLIPLSESSFQASILSYQSGKSSFAMVLDNYRMLLMARLDYLMNIMNAAVSESDLERAVGLRMDQIKEKLN